MQRVLIVLCVLAVSLAGRSAFAGDVFGEGGMFAKENFSATFTMRSDYVFRGVSYSDRDPSVAGTFDWSHSLGDGGTVFAGIGGASLSGYSNYHSTIYPYIGYANSIGAFNYSILPIWYSYPNAHDRAGETDAGEIYFNVSRGIEGPGSPTVGMFYSFSPDWSYTNWGIAHYFEPSIAFNLPRGFGLNFTAGYQYVEGKHAQSSPQAFWNWTVGLSNSFLGFNWDVRMHDMDVDLDSPLVKDYWGDTRPDLHLFKRRVVFTVSRSF